jgi:hypothetical protein
MVLSRKQLSLLEVPPEVGVHRDWRRGRFELVWTAGELGIPSDNADIVSTTEATAVTCDRDFEVQGTNAGTDDVLHVGTGGLQAQTDGADNDQVILVPHQDANQSPWAQVTWGTDQETRYEALVKTPTDILTGIHLVVGLKTDLDMTLNDDDLVVFNFNTDDSDRTWGVVANVNAGTATDTDTGIVVSPNRIYEFVIDFDNAGCAHCYIDDVLVAEVDFAGAAADLKPLIGLQSLSGTTDELVYYTQKLGRNYA